MSRAAFILLAVTFVLFAGKLSALTPEEAAQHIGKEGAVDGLAVEVSEANGNVFVNLGAKYPDQLFTGFVSKDDVAAVGLDYLKSMAGKPVSIVGRIVKMKGKPQIQITKKEQIILTVQPK